MNGGHDQVGKYNETIEAQWQVLLGTRDLTAEKIIALFHHTIANYPVPMGGYPGVNLRPYVSQSLELLPVPEILRLLAWSLQLASLVCAFWLGGQRIDAYAVIVTRRLSRTEVELLRVFCYDPEVAIRRLQGHLARLQSPILLQNLFLAIEPSLPFYPPLDDTLSKNYST